MFLIYNIKVYNLYMKEINIINIYISLKIYNFYMKKISYKYYK